MMTKQGMEGDGGGRGSLTPDSHGPLAF
jgi:hypothetical protein